MDHYYVNNTAQSNGDHEVHKRAANGCQQNQTGLILDSFRIALKLYPKDVSITRKSTDVQLVAVHATLLSAHQGAGSPNQAKRS